MDFDKEINLDELAKNINMRRELEAQETTSEPVQEYLNMDKITLVPADRDAASVEQDQ